MPYVIVRSGARPAVLSRPLRTGRPLCFTFDRGRAVVWDDDQSAREWLRAAVPRRQRARLTIVPLGSALS